MPLRPGRPMMVPPATFEGRLAQLILTGAPNASQAAMALFERFEPQTVGAAVSLVSRQGRVTADAFDRIADAWETYRHLQHLTWD
jgi:hypothetical protein